MKFSIVKYVEIAALLIIVCDLLIFSGCSSGNQTVCSHNYYLSSHSDATSSENGFNEYTCSNCGKSYREVIPPKGMEEGNSNGTSDIEAPDLTRKQSVNLFDMPAYSDKDVLSGSVGLLEYESEAIDVEGWKHSDCYRICGSKYEAWVRYELDGKYSTIFGKLYDANDSGGSGWLEFYDGDDFLAATPKVDSTSTSAEFEIDITDVEFLTVHFRATEAGTWMIADDIVLTRE